MDGARQPASLPQLAEPLVLHMAQLCGLSARLNLRATCTALRSAIAPTRIQLLLGPNPSDEWADEHVKKRHAAQVQHFQQDWSLSAALAARWRHVNTGRVLIGGYADNRPMPDNQHGAAWPAHQLHFASGTLAHWGQLQEVRAPFSRALVTTLVASCTQLRALELSDGSYMRADLAGSEWDPARLETFLREEVCFCLQALPGCRALRQLHLHIHFSDAVRNGDWHVLSQLTQLQALELELGMLDVNSNHDVSTCVGALTQLTKLVLSASYQHDLGAHVKLGPLPHLQQLEVDREARLASIVGCPQLTCLRVGARDPPGLSALGPLQQLQVLSVGYHNWGADEVMLALATCPHLRVLCLDTFCPKFDHPLPAGSAFHHLQELHVASIALPQLPQPASSLAVDTVAEIGMLARLMPCLTSLCVEVDKGDNNEPHNVHFLRGHTALRHLGLPGLRCLQHEGASEFGCLLDVADLAALPSLTSLEVDFHGEHFRSTEAPQESPPALLHAILQPTAWQHIRQLAVRNMDTPAQHEELAMLLRAAPALRALRFHHCHATQLMGCVPYLRSVPALRTITLCDNNYGAELAAGSPAPHGASPPPFLQSFLHGLASPQCKGHNLACVWLELEPLLLMDWYWSEWQGPGDPAWCRAQRVAVLRRIRGHIDATAQLLPEGQLPFAVHIEEMEQVARNWPN